MTTSNITKGFWFAGVYNVIGVLIFSKVFTNTHLMSVDPVLFSAMGLGAIMLWGFAYASVARAYQAVPYLVLVFFVEKFFYGIYWLTWHYKNAGSMPALFAESPLTAIFYATYGAGDILFGLFFLWVGTKSLRR